MESLISTDNLSQFTEARSRLITTGPTQLVNNRHQYHLLIFKVTTPMVLVVLVMIANKNYSKK